MIVTCRHMISTAFLLFALTGCAGAFSPKHPPEYFQLEYAYAPVDCALKRGEGLRVWPFSAAAPYDRDQMMVVDPSRGVHFSSRYRWVASPGNMSSDMLLRDLARGEVFAAAVPAGDPYAASTQMSGNIFRFGLEKTDSSYRADLEVEITVWSEKPKREILFKKRYSFLGDPVAEGSPQRFAEAMSGLVGKLSLQLREDLCSMPTGSSSPDGG